MISPVPAPGREAARDTSRRGFLVSLAAAFALDPERALWVPGAKLISVPAPQRQPHKLIWRDGLLHCTDCERNIEEMVRMVARYRPSDAFLRCPEFPAPPVGRGVECYFARGPLRPESHSPGHPHRLQKTEADAHSEVRNLIIEPMAREKAPKP